MLASSNNGWIGVDIGDRAIKVAQLRRVGGRLSLSTASAYRRPGERFALRDDLLAVKAMSAELRGKRAAAALSMRDSLVEAAEKPPHGAPAGRCCDYWATGPESGYTLSLPAERVDSVLDGLGRVGMHCDVIDGPPLALARALRLTPNCRGDELIGGLDWGETAVTFVASLDGEARYARRLGCDGFEAVRREVAAELGVSEAEADRSIATHGAPTGARVAPEARLVQEAFRSATRPLLNELHRTLEHLGGKLKRRPPERIALFGCGALTPGAGELIGEATGCRVEPWRAAGLDREDDAAPPDCLMAQAIALSALAW